MPPRDEDGRGSDIEEKGEQTPFDLDLPGVPARISEGETLPAPRATGVAHSARTSAAPETAKDHPQGQLIPVHSDALIQSLAARYGLGTVQLGVEEQDQAAHDALPVDRVIRKFNVFPLRIEGKTLVVVVSDPSNPEVEDAIRFNASRPFRLAVDSADAIKEAIERYYGVDLQERVRAGQEVLRDPIDGEVDQAQVEAWGKDERIRKFVFVVLNSAVAMRASDIHIERYHKDWRIRFCIDGRLVEFSDKSQKEKLPLEMHRMVVSVIKVMSELDISETRAPQDGLLRVVLDCGEVEFRVATAPTLFGEKVVLRNFYAGEGKVTLDGLGFSFEDLVILRDAINQPQGLVLVTGPTGSGKTTTLEAALHELNRADINIMTVEDPIERPIPGINQVQMNEKKGVSFASALRAFMRMKPDVIMVGEIRDFETADVVVKAALTGHLVLTTLHTNNTIQTVNRLIDIGIERFNLLPALKLICAQRLVRRICDRCKRVPVEMSIGRLVEMGFSENEAVELRIFRGTGTDHNGRLCRRCQGTGFYRRVAVYEIMQLTPVLREAFIDQRSTDEILPLALRQGMVTLRRAGLRKVIEGVTTVDEILRVTTMD